MRTEELNSEKLLSKLIEATRSGRLLWKTESESQFSATVGEAMMVVLDRHWKIVPIELHEPESKTMSPFEQLAFGTIEVGGGRPTRRISRFRASVRALADGQPDGDALAKVDSFTADHDTVELLDELWTIVVDRTSAPTKAVQEVVDRLQLLMED